MRNSFLIIFLFVIAGTTHSQDIGGTWKGNFRYPGGCFTENNIELRLTVRGDSVLGKTYHYQDKDVFIVKDCVGIYDSVKKSLMLNETVLFSYQLPDNCVICMKKFQFLYSGGTQEILQGTWTGTLINSRTECMPGTLSLYKVNEVSK